MNQLQVFENELFKVSAKQENGQVLFDVEEVAKSLGIVQKKQNDKYVRWERVNSYLPKNSPQVGKGDLIPEPLVYKLAFKAQNEVAEKFQDWLAIEVIPTIRKTGSYEKYDTSQLSPELQMFKQIFDSVATTQLKQQEQDKRIELVESQQEAIKEVVATVPKSWRSWVNKIITKISKTKNHLDAYKETRLESYELLETRGRCDLETRLNNLQERMKKAGASKSAISRINKMDVIENDTRLMEIYVAIIKEMAIKHGVERVDDHAS